MLVDYIAKRSIKSGHSVDTAYQIDIENEVFDRQYKPASDRNISLNGNTVDVIHRRDVILRFRTVVVSSTTTPDTDDMLEFLDSTATNESFTLTIDSVAYTCIMDNPRRPYTATRVGVSDLFKYSFITRVRA